MSICSIHIRYSSASCGLRMGVHAEMTVAQFMRSHRRHICESHEVLGVQIFLVGTAHVSRDSADEVRELIQVVRPSTIMVELCQKRADKLRSSPKVQCSSGSLACMVSCTQHQCVQPSSLHVLVMKRC